jgi:hypothetical protein
VGLEGIDIEGYGAVELEPTTGSNWDCFHSYMPHPLQGQYIRRSRTTEDAALVHVAYSYSPQTNRSK